MPGGLNECLTYHHHHHHHIIAYVALALSIAAGQAQSVTLRIAMKHAVPAG